MLSSGIEASRSCLAYDLRSTELMSRGLTLLASRADFVLVAAAIVPSCLVLIRASKNAAIRKMRWLSHSGWWHWKPYLCKSKERQKAVCLLCLLLPDRTCDETVIHAGEPSSSSSPTLLHIHTLSARAIGTANGLLSKHLRRSHEHSTSVAS